MDWIVMKCLEKDRTRRYETANGLAADLKRHFESEPVVARPPSSGYKFRKAVKRNKLAFSAAAAVTIGLMMVSVLLFRERAAFAAMRLAEQEAAVERVYFAILSGDAERTRRALQEAKEKGVATAQMHHLRGFHLLTTMEARRAIDELAKAHQLEPENVATLGLLATATLVGRGNKGWETYETLVPALRSARPVTPEDFLFLGQALNVVDPKMGFDLMERAVHEKDSPVARLILAGARTEAAKQAGSGALVDAALADVAAASSWGGHSLPVLMAGLEAHLVSAALHRKAGNSERALADTEAAERLSERLEAFHPNVQALRARLVHLILGGQGEKALTRALRWAAEFPRADFHVYAIWVLLKGDQFERILELSKGNDAPVVLLARFLARLEVPGTENEAADLLKHLSERPSKNVGDLFCAVSANQLVGRAETATEIGRSAYKRNDFAVSNAPSAAQAAARYLGGVITETEALNADLSVSSKCTVHHFIALRHFSLGEKEKARAHFEASRDSGAEGEIAQIFSEYILKRIVTDSEWPRTVFSRN